MESVFAMNPWIVIAAVALFSFVIGRMSVRDTATGRRRQRAGQTNIQAGSAIPDTTGLAEVRKLMASGHKINAIKHYREMTGCGLKEAKDFVESLER